MTSTDTTTEATSQDAFKPAKGMYVKFLGYASATDDEILKPGQIVFVQSYDDDKGMVCVPFGSQVGENLFDEEVGPATEEEIAAARAEAEAAMAEAPKASKAKAKTTEAAPIKAKAKATPKAKAEPKPAADTAVAETSGGDGDMQFTIVNDLAAVRTLLDAQDAHDAAKSLVETMEEQSFTLGGVLAHIYQEGLFKGHGYSGKRAFAEYVEKELGVAYRKARYLINIYVKVTSLGISEERLAGIGWSKVKELTNIDSKDEFESMLDYAREHSRNELVEHVRTTFENASDETGETRVKRTKLTLAFTSEAYENVKAGIDAAASMAGSTDPSACIEYIVGEWRSMQTGIEVPVEDAIALLEAKYGVRLQIAEPETAEAASAEVTA